MRMTRGWALFFGILISAMALWYLAQDVVFGLRHGFNALELTDFDDSPWWKGPWGWGILTEPHHYVAIPLDKLMLRHAGGLLIGLAIVAGCWLLAWWHQRATGELPVRAESKIHIVRHDDR